MEEILPLLHDVGNKLIEAYPNQPDALTTIAGVTFRFIYQNNVLVQIGQYDVETDRVTRILFEI